MHRQTNTSPGPIIVGVDNTPAARAAVQYAASIAHRSGRGLHLVHAVGRRAVVEVAGVGTDRYSVDLQRAAEDMLNALIGDLVCREHVTTAALVGRPAPVLRSEARRLSAPLIVLGDQGQRTRLRLRRSIAGALTHDAPCDVEFVPSGHGPALLVARFT